MASISVTYSFSNGTAADATQVNQNFTDIINGTSDGTKDLSISAITAAGTATFNGNTVIGNASSDTLTITSSLASTIAIGTTTSYDIGSTTIGLRAIYLGDAGSAARCTKLLGATIASGWTFTFPTGVPAGASYVLESTTGGATSWTSRTKLATTSKTTTYTADPADDIIFVSAASSWTLTLPAAASNTGKVFKVIRTDNAMANNVTIDPNASETIGGYTTVTLNTQYEAWEFVSDGTNWQVIQHKARTPWTTYTPSTNGLGTITSNLTQWRRVGDTMEIRSNFTTGTCTAAAARIAFPANTSIDTNKRSGSHYHGVCAGDFSVTANVANHLIAFVDTGQTANISFCGRGDGSAKNFLTEINGNAIFSNATAYSFIAVGIPITNWYE